MGKEGGAHGGQQGQWTWLVMPTEVGHYVMETAWGLQAGDGGSEGPEGLRYAVDVPLKVQCWKLVSSVVC